MSENKFAKFKPSEKVPNRIKPRYTILKDPKTGKFKSMKKKVKPPQTDNE
jgi:hypothetical protein